MLKLYVMEQQGIPKAEQLTLREVAIKAGLQKLDLAAGMIIGAIHGAIEGGKLGIASVQSCYEEQAENMAQIENFANDPVQHDQ